MRTLCALLSLLTCSCVGTSFTENYPNGTVKYAYKTRGDHGTTTSVKMGDNAKTGSIPFLSNNSQNDYDITQKTSDGETYVKVGENFEHRGTLTHSTGMGVVAKATVRGIKEAVLGILGWKGLDTWGSIENGKTAAEVSKSKSKDGVKIADSNNNLKAIESNNATKVQLETLSE